MTVLWTTEELPAEQWDPEPDEDDGPWCRTPGLLSEQHDRVDTLTVIGDLL